MYNIMQIQYSSRFNEIADKNDSFAIGKLLIAYTGKNRNNSFISKESFEKAIPSIYNCPIVAKYSRELNQIGGHDGEWVEKDGKKEYVNTTHPVGVIPESAEYEWVEIEDNNEMHEYIMVDALLWKRQEAYTKIKEAGVTSQSMEINVKNGEFVDGIYKIYDFEFTAFCLLGVDEPCFESASLFTFSSDGEKNQYVYEFKEMMDELKAMYSSNNKAKEEYIEMNLDMYLEKYNISADEITEDIRKSFDGLSEPEIEEKILKMLDKDDKDEKDEKDGEIEKNNKLKKENDDDDSSVVEEEQEEDKDNIAEEEAQEDTPTDTGGEESSGGATEGEEDAPADTGFKLNRQIEESLISVISKREKVKPFEGSDYEVPKYWFLDYDAELSEVYYECCEDDEFLIFAAPYSFNGDVIVVDFEKEKRQKIAFVDFENGQTSEENNESGLIKEYQKFISNLLIENKELNKYKNIQIEQEKAKLFSEFDTKIHDCPEYDSLKENAKSYDYEALKKEVFALFGKLQFTITRTDNNTNSPSVVLNTIGDDIQNSFAYGGLFEKNGFQKNK